LNKWQRLFLSLFIVFHFSVVVLLPNSQTYLGLRSAWFFEPYAQVFLLMTKWSFFAPEPGPPPVFVEWELLDRKGATLEMGRWPSSPDPFFLRERQNRRIAAAQSMVDSDGRAERMIVPYLCEKNPLTFSVKLWGLMYAIPSLSEIATGTRRIGDEVGMNRHWIAHSFCGDFKR